MMTRVAPTLLLVLLVTLTQPTHLLAAHHNPSFLAPPRSITTRHVKHTNERQLQEFGQVQNPTPLDPSMGVVIDGGAANSNDNFTAAATSNAAVITTTTTTTSPAPNFWFGLFAPADPTTATTSTSITTVPAAPAFPDGDASQNAPLISSGEAQGAFYSDQQQPSPQLNDGNSPSGMMIPGDQQQMEQPQVEQPQMEQPQMEQPQMEQADQQQMEQAEKQRQSNRPEMDDALLAPSVDVMQGNSMTSTTSTTSHILGQWDTGEGPLSETTTASDELEESSKHQPSLLVAGVGATGLLLFGGVAFEFARGKFLARPPAGMMRLNTDDEPYEAPSTTTTNGHPPQQIGQSYSDSPPPPPSRRLSTVDPFRHDDELAASEVVIDGGSDDDNEVRSNRTFE